MSEGTPLRDARFAPMFFTQFAGAFNDNLFKNALVISVGFGTTGAFGLPPDQVVALSSAVFILPFFLFSATAGQLADKYEKSQLVRATKVAEIGIMVLGAVGFLIGSPEWLIAILFLMGAQSAFFGPVKYSIIPQLVAEDRLVASNALVEMATYLAILAGTISGGVLIGLSFGGNLVGPPIVAASVIAVAIAGWTVSRRIPECPASLPDLPVSWDPVRPTWEIVRLSMQNLPVFRSILAITWFWGFGSVLLSLFPTWTKDTLHATPEVATLFLALFSVGIGVGSMLCERLSGPRVELGIVPLGSFGMTLFAVDLFLIGEPWTLAPGQAPYGVVAFLSTFTGWRVAADLVGLALSGGVFIVPLYSYMQLRTPAELRSRVVAGNNIINSAFMVAAAVLLMVGQGAGLSAPQLFLATALLNALVALYIYTVMPEFVLRFLAWILGRVMYRIEAEGLARVPHDGPAVFVCNHVTFVDWLLIGGTIPRPVRFVMDASFAENPVMRFVCGQARVIPITSAKRDPAVLEAAMAQIAAELDAGWAVCIFPEGKLSSDGSIDAFRPGIERILARNPVPVVPMAMNGMWGSWFSRRAGSAMKGVPRRFWSRVWLTIGEPVDGASTTAADLEGRVRALWSRRDAP